MSLIRYFIFLFILILGIWMALYFIRFHTSRAMVPIRGEYLKVNGYQIYINAQGEGKPVLFLHGFPYHSETFQELCRNPWPGYRLITMDFPGAGYSSKNFNQPVNPEELALLVKLVLDRLGIEEVDLVGHDLGGGVGLICAVLYPKLIKHLVLIAPDSSVGSGAEYFGWWWQIPGLSEAWAALRLDRTMIRRLLKKSWSPHSKNWHQLVERYYRPLETAGGRQGFLYLHRGRSQFNYLPYEERVKVKTLLIWGGNDQILLTEKGKQLAQRLAQSELIVIPEAGHLPQEEVPAQVNQWLQTFLESAASQP